MSIPNCPITMEPVRDPVVDPDGNTYERTAIIEWVREHGTSPITRRPLAESELVPNRALRDIIEGNTSGSTVIPDLPVEPEQSYIETLDGTITAFRESVDRKGVPYEVVTLRCVGGRNGNNSSINNNNSINNNSCSNNSSNDVDIGNDASHLSAGGRHPCHVCCVIDVSGSMCAAAGIKEVGGKSEDTGLSVLDLVKHAVATVAASLSSRDTLSIVSFSDAAKIVLEPTAMGPSGRETVKARLATMRPSGRTNLWDGMRTAIDLAVGLEKSEGAKRPSFIYTLTDGEPNVEPPRGHIPTLKRYLGQYAFHGVISTFGFGYSLDSKLLRELAVVGKGSFNFIPDAGMVGTIFINSLAATRSSCATSVCVTIPETEELSVDAGLVGMKSEAAGNGMIKATLGSIRYGHEQTIVFRGTAGRAMEFNFMTPDGKRTDRNEVAVAVSSEERNKRAPHHVLRALITEYLAHLSSLSGLPGDDEKARIKEYIEELRALSIDWSTALAEDLEGQVLEAISRQDWFSRWGAHYLRSLSDAHREMITNNFKDPGVQCYGEGSSLFTELQDDLNDIFVKLPPPEPSRRRAVPTGYGGGGGMNHSIAMAAPSIDMSRYNDRTGACFHPSTMLTVVDDNISVPTAVGNLNRGDIVRTGRGNQLAKIRCIVQLRVPHGRAKFVRLADDAIVTPYHPVLRKSFHDQHDHENDHDWVWPSDADVTDRNVMSMDAEVVYNLVVESANDDKEALIRPHSVLLGTNECWVAITLGHNQKGGIAQHAYFGTERCIRDLEKMPGYDSADGKVLVSKDDVVRDERNNEVIAIVANKTLKVNA